MYIDDLQDKYPNLYAVASENVLKQSNHYHLYKRGSGVRVSDMFDWSQSPQGHSFWSAIDDNHIEEAKQLHPELFRTMTGTPIAVSNLTYIENGLWQ